MLLDTSVLVDLLRGHEPAIDWLEDLPEDFPMAMSGIALMELVRGEMKYGGGSRGQGGGTRRSESGIPQSQEGVRRIMNVFESWPAYWPSEAAGAKALRTMRRLYPAHQVSIPDLLIGHTAIERNLALAAMDTDFQHLEQEGLAVVRPYRGPAASSTRPEEPLDSD